MRHVSIGAALMTMLLISIAGCDDGITETDEITEESTQSADDSIPGVLKTAVQTPDGCYVVSYEVRNGLGYFEDDIILGPADKLSAVTECAPAAKSPQGAEPKIAQSKKRGAVRLIASKWPNGNVFFQTPTFAVSQIKQAIALWDASPDVAFHEISSCLPALPCIRFVVDVFDPNTGSSSIGMQGGAQEIRLGVFVVGNVTVIAHEIGHALGMPHEHTRADRDSHVIINWGCIPMGRWHNFERSLWNIGLTAYDYRSIMHYAANAFPLFSGCTTILAKNGNTISPSTAPTSSDLATINAWY